MAMICTVCGAENMEGSIYCEDCGARLPVSGGAPTPAATPIAPPPIPAAPPAAIAPPPAAAAVVEAAEVTQEAMPAVSGGPNTCGTCGAENAAGEKYCEDCGADLGESPSVIPPMPVTDIAATPPPITAAPTTPAEAVASVAAGKPRLEAVETGQTFILSKDENDVGRRSPVDGIFPEVDLTEADKDSYISRRHGKIIMGEQGPVYEDLGSSNGSFHNGTKLSKGVQALLKPGDKLRLGKTDMIYSDH